MNTKIRIAKFIAIFYLLALVALGFAAPSEASTSGAARAVKQEVKFDYGPEASYIDAYCRSAGNGNYRCNFDFLDTDNRNQRGKARVTKYGRSYSVSYRIYWK